MQPDSFLDRVEAGLASKPERKPQYALDKGKLRVKFDPYGDGYDFDTAAEIAASNEYKLTLPKPTDIPKSKDDYTRFSVNEDGTESFEAWVWHPEKNEWRKHGGSIDPRDGKVLKAKGHPTYDKFLKREKELGNKVVERDGRIFVETRGK